MPEDTLKPRTRSKSPKRMQTVQKMNLSEHTLNVNTRKCSLEKFRFADIEDYVRALTAGRDYQFNAIKEVMIYLWGGSYSSIEELAKENWKVKPQIRDRFGSEEIFYGHFPLRDRISGVVHMATGTGKSFVIFAVAHLSVVMGLTKRVLVLGPSSTIIEQGLREKFEVLMRDQKLNELLPKEYQNRAINLLTDNDAIEDDSIVIENINAVWGDRLGGINDTMFKNTDDVLVLSDEVHHAYSHLKFNEEAHTLELDSDATGGRETDEKAERLWMKFIRDHKEIKRHIGFTGTPYNANDYFADVIVDYSINTALVERHIKEINPLLKTEDVEGEAIQWTDDRRFEVVLKSHLDNKEKYSYVRNGKATVKPITVFICPNQAKAKTAQDNFVRFLRNWEKNENGMEGTDSAIEQEVRKRAICVISNISESEFKPQLDNIEETDPTKVGGIVEFIFAVNKLSEGWDVDNVFQIVPMEERVFNSKLLISQVLGRGLRIPRKIDVNKLHMGEYYPRVTITNHEKFAKHIEELMDAVIQSDMHIASEPLIATTEDKDVEEGRSKHHFTVFNLNYLSATRLVDADEDPQLKTKQSRSLKLTAQDLSEPVTIEYLKEKKEFIFKKKTTTVDRVVDDISRRFKNREYEGIRFDFGQGEQERCPTEKEIRTVIGKAMEESGITGNQLSEENRLQIELYFNQFLPKGKKKREFENILGDVVPISTHKLERVTVRLGELERDATVFLSEDYADELDAKSRLVVSHLEEARTKTEAEKLQASLFQFDPQDFLGKHKEYARSIVDGDQRSPYIINPNVLKSPQSAVLVSHTPEKSFVFMLLQNAKYIDGWVKSPDKGFYSLDYDYWKGGKDRVRRSFNPDFFIVQKLSTYISLVRSTADAFSMAKLKALEEEGVEELVWVVEIKSDEDQDDTISPKAEAGKAHFEALNNKLKDINPVNVPAEVRKHLKQRYFFELIRPNQFTHWFKALQEGK